MNYFQTNNTDKKGNKYTKYETRKGVLHVGHEFRCAIGCNEFKGFIYMYLCDDAYLRVVFSFNVYASQSVFTISGNKKC